MKDEDAMVVLQEVKEEEQEKEGEQQGGRMQQNTRAQLIANERLGMSQGPIPKAETTPRA